MAMYADCGLSEEKDPCNLVPVTLPAGCKTKPCTKFFSTSGCPYGEVCHFLHFVAGGIAALGIQLPSSKLQQQHTANGSSVSINDPSLTVNGYKTRLCNRFNTPEGCRFGDNCHFAHGEADLRRGPAVMRPSYQPVDPSNGYVISSSTINYNPDGSYNAVATATGAYAPPYTNLPTYPHCAYPAYPSVPCSTNYTSCATTNYTSPTENYSSYPSLYTDSDSQGDSNPNSSLYHEEPTPPGVTAVPPVPSMAPPTCTA